MSNRTTREILIRSRKKGRSRYFTVQANLNSWISAFFLSLFILFIYIRCRLYIWKMELWKAWAKKGDGIQKFTYRCDMGAHARIVPQLFIVMTSTISNYLSAQYICVLSLSCSLAAFFNINHFSGRKWSTFLVLYLIKIAFFFLLSSMLFVLYASVPSSNNHYCLLLIRWDAIIL